MIERVYVTDATKSGEDEPKPKRLTKIVGWIEERGETAIALAVAVSATIYAALGKVDTVGELAPLVLGVLVVMALALVIERERRIKESQRLDRIAGDLGRTAEGIEILGTPTPYHVILSESLWEIEANGNAHTTRLKRLRFTQDDVIAVTEWHRGDGKIESIDRLVGKAKPVEDTPAEDQRDSLKATQVIHTFPSRGRELGLVPLDRAYVRDEECDYVIDRRSKGLFPKNPDRSWVTILESTSLVRIVVRWADRHPTEVRLIRQHGPSAGRPLKFPPTTRDDGRTEFRISIPEPRLGEQIGVEWDWPPTTKQELPSTEQVEPVARLKWFVSAKYRRERKAKNAHGQR
jgi:hypothetical protein